MDYALAKKVVNYFNENESTSRKTAKHFGLCHSTVLRYLREVSPNPTSDKILAANILDYRIGGKKSPIWVKGKNETPGRNLVFCREFEFYNNSAIYITNYSLAQSQKNLRLILHKIRNNIVLNLHKIIDNIFFKYINLYYTNLLYILYLLYILTFLLTY